MGSSRIPSRSRQNSGTKDDDLFEYQPLDHTTNEIRLLYLLPAHDPLASIRCELRHVPLPAETEYEALSYCWGSNETPKRVLLNEHRFAVTDSLHSALLVLREPDEARILWIDAICMNQNDDDEKSREVWRMLEVYSNATSVVIWLGEASADSDLAITHLEGLAADWAKEPNLSDYLQLGFDTLKALAGYVGFIALALNRTYRRRKGNAIGFHILLSWFVPGYPDRYLWKLFVFFWMINLACRTIGELFAIALENSRRQAPPAAPQDAGIAAVCSFFSRPWFNRTWTIQEIVAARQATVICGIREMPLESLHAACDRTQDLINGVIESPYIDSNF